MPDSVMQKESSPDSSIENDRSLFSYALIALVLALIIRFFIATPYIVQGASMEHVFENHDYLIIDRLTYDVSTPKRGDVVVFGLPQETSRDLIKRVIGLPEETVVLSGKAPDVTIINATHPNGFKLDQSYLSAENLGGSTNMRVTLGPDEYFVLGDNRRVSSDSRIWGVLPRKDIVGRVFVRLFPFSMISLFPGKAHYQD
ncbi:signal peptidase I [Candidatus Kaiserbacteria bacterium]|nr:signal peptidase I [Candidatus Kaiserbacteria bacterium]